MPRLYRSRTRLVSGVAAGIAERLGLSPWLVRIAWVVSVPFTLFLSVAAYALLAVVLPVEPEGRTARPVGWETFVRQAFALFWALHGIIHVIGFTAAWKLAGFRDVAYSTTLFDGRIDVGDTGARLVGIAWLLMIPLFLAAAVSIARNGRHAIALTGVSAAASLVICLAGLPAAIAGLAINAVALVALAGLVGWRSVAAQPHPAAR